MLLTALETIFSEARTVADRFAAGREAGFDGIDLRDHAHQVEEVIRAKETSGLEVGMIYSAMPIPLLAATAVQRAAAVQLLSEKIRAGAAVGARGVVVVPVFGPPRLTSRTCTEIATAEKIVLDCLLGELEPVLAESGIYLAIEPLNREETHLFNRPSDVARWLAGPLWPGVLTMADTYHMDHDGQDGVAEVHAARGLLGCIHLAGPDRTLPGPEAVDFDALFRQLQADGYEGPMGFECRPQRTAAIAESVRFIRQVWN